MENEIILKQIEKDTNKIEKLLEGITDTNTKFNRDRLHKAYELIFKVNYMFKKIKRD